MWFFNLFIYPVESEFTCLHPPRTWDHDFIKTISFDGNFYDYYTILHSLKKQKKNKNTLTYLDVHLGEPLEPGKSSKQKSFLK